MPSKRRKENPAVEVLRQGEWLASLLNQQAAGLKNLAALLDDLRAYTAVYQQWLRSSRLNVRQLRNLLDSLRPLPIFVEVHDRLWWRKVDQWMPAELATLHRSLEERFSRYTTQPLLLLNRGSISIDYSLNNVQMIEAQAFRTLQRLIEHGKLEMLRRCAYAACSKWIFGSRHDQKFCSSECRQSDFESSPKQKEKRRKKARAQYAQTFGKPRPYRRNPKGAQQDER